MQGFFELPHAYRSLPTEKQSGLGAHGWRHRPAVSVAVPFTRCRTRRVRDGGIKLAALGQREDQASRTDGGDETLHFRRFIILAIGDWKRGKIISGRKQIESRECGKTNVLALDYSAGGSSPTVQALIINVNLINDYN